MIQNNGKTSTVSFYTSDVHGFIVCEVGCLYIGEGKETGEQEEGGYGRLRKQGRDLHDEAKKDECKVHVQCSDQV